MGNKTLVDTLAGGALALALFTVFLVDRLTRADPGQAGPNTLDVRLVADSSRRLAAQKKLRLAVVPTHREWDARINNWQVWDDMSKLLLDLGDGYRFDEVKAADILDDPKKLDDYDVLFLTCAPGGQELSTQLYQFVDRGGVLYASDWRYAAVAAAFPGFVDPRTQGGGVPQNLDAEVVDPALRDVIGAKIHLKFDLGSWKTAAFAGPKVTTLIEGAYRRERDRKDMVGVPARAPLLVKFPVGKGTVIFTSFHNEKQNSDIETKLLQYLVFSMVTAGIDSAVQDNISEGGFAPQRSNLLSTPRENPSVTKTYTSQKAGTLRFALGFRNEGAKLRLHLKAPDGRQFSWEGESTAIFDVPNAAQGEWTYTVTALHLPYANFPFTVTVGEKK
jgi:hypothetical protein